MPAAVSDPVSQFTHSTSWAAALSAAAAAAAARDVGTCCAPLNSSAGESAAGDRLAGDDEHSKAIAVVSSPHDIVTCCFGVSGGNGSDRA